MSPYALAQRRGFTMVELLVVITVIVIMLTLLVGASYRFVVSARESATAATITKVNGIIQERVNAFRDFDFSTAGISTSVGWNLNVASPQITPGMAEILMRKVRFKRAFPQSFNEMDTNQTARLFPTAPGTYSAKYESGIVLYAVLIKGETFGAPTPGVDAFTGAEIRNNADTGNVPCLVDAWGEPLRFYRWPTRLLRCGEQDFDGNGTSSDASGKYYDLNQNGQRDAAGFGGPIIRPYRGIYTGATPSSLLIAGLPQFDRTSGFAYGTDGAPGIAGIDDDQNGTTDWVSTGVPDPGEVGWPNSDDPEFLNTDPDDQSFLLWDWLFFWDPTVLPPHQPSSPRSPQYSQFVNLTGTDFKSFFSYKHDCCTYHTPLIVSSGPDKRLGLYEPTDMTNFGYLANPEVPPSGSTFASWTMQNLMDNITNLNQRAGGK